MLEILAGVVTAYDAGEGRATLRMRVPLRRGDSVQIVGPNTDCDFKLKAPRLCGPTAGSDGGEHVIDVLTPRVEAGDLVYRVLGKAPDALS